MRFALLALVFAGSALAQPVPQASPGSVSYPVSTVRNISTIGAGAINPANVGRYAFAHAIGGNVVADASTGLPLPDGRILPVTVRSTIPKAQATAAIGRFLRKGLPFIGTGVALYDLGQELGFGLEQNGGSVVITETSKPPVGYDGKEWTAPNFTPTVWWETRQAACDGTARNRGLSGPPWDPNTWKCVNAFAVVNPPRFTMSLQTGGSLSDWQLSSRTDPTPFVPTAQPSTPEKFEQAINAKNDWQPPSALGRSLVDAIKAGELIQAPPQTVTGPASTPGPSSTTTDAVYGTTTTTTTEYHHTYNGPNVTTTQTTTNVTVDNSTGATISNTTTNVNPVMPEKSEEKDEEDTTFSNADLPTIPKLYDPEFPDGLEGVWNDRKAQLLDTSLFQLIPSLMPNMGDGGCPTWSIPSIYGGNLNASIPCSVWYFIRLVIIISALLLARRLIFGG